MSRARFHQPEAVDSILQSLGFSNKLERNIILERLTLLITSLVLMMKESSEGLFRSHYDFNGAFLHAEQILLSHVYGMSFHESPLYCSIFF